MKKRKNFNRKDMTDELNINWLLRMSEKEEYLEFIA